MQRRGRLMLPVRLRQHLQYVDSLCVVKHVQIVGYFLYLSILLEAEALLPKSKSRAFALQADY